MLLTPCLSVVGMKWCFCFCYWLPLWNFFHPVFVRKNFYPSHFLGAREGLNEKCFLCSLKIFLVCFLNLMVSAIRFLNFFPNRYSSCFCRSDAFSLNIDFTWYWEFITLPNTFNFLWYVITLGYVPVAIQSVHCNGASHL